MDVDQAISHLEPPRGPLMACSRTVLPLWAAPASGPLLPASAGPSAHLFPPLCLLYLCGLCPWQKKNPGADAPSEARVGLVASAEWCSDGLTFAFFWGVGAVGSP